MLTLDGVVLCDEPGTLAAADAPVVNDRGGLEDVTFGTSGARPGERW